MRNGVIDSKDHKHVQYASVQSITANRRSLLHRGDRHASEGEEDTCAPTRRTARHNRNARASRSAWLPEAIASRLADLAALPRNWDSYGAHPISERALFLAEFFVLRGMAHLKHLGASSTEPFAVAPVSDGGVQIEWRGASGSVEVEISPDGDIGLLLVRGDGPMKAVQEMRGAPWDDVASLLSTIGA